MNIKILVDSGSDINQSDCEKYNITVVPLTIVIDGVPYTDYYDFNSEEYCEKLRTLSQIPTTSQPSPSTFISYYQKYDKENDAIILVTMSSDGSGTYSSACLAKQLYEDDGGKAEIFIVDSRLTSSGIFMLASHAAELANKGMEASEIVAELERYKYRITAFFLIDNIEFLIKGGRISATAGAVASKLNIKPIITISSGEAAVHSKVMGYNKGIAKLVSLYEKLAIQGAEVFISYTGGKNKVENLITALKNKKTDIAYHISQMHGTMSTHTGPDTVGMFFLLD